MRVRSHRRVVLILPVVAVVSTLTACGATDPPPAATTPTDRGGQLLVLVSTGSGLPLAGVAVTVVETGGTTRTDVRGQATLAATPGTSARVRAELSGYVSTEQSVAAVDSAVSTAVRVTMAYVPPNGAFVQRTGPFDADQLVVTAAVPPTATLVHYDYSCNLGHWREAKRTPTQPVTWRETDNDFVLANGNPLAVVSAPQTIDSRWAAVAPETLTPPTCPTPTATPTSSTTP